MRLLKTRITIEDLAGDGFCFRKILSSQLQSSFCECVSYLACLRGRVIAVIELRIEFVGIDFYPNHLRCRLKYRFAKTLGGNSGLRRQTLTTICYCHHGHCYVSRAEVS